VTVLSYAFWENSLGADPAVLGKEITVNGQHLTIIGVAPRALTARPSARVRTCSFRSAMSVS